MLSPTAVLSPSAVLSSVPFSLGTYGTAVALAGHLTSTQVLALNCGTYGVAHIAIAAWRQRLRGRAEQKGGSDAWGAGIELGIYILAGATCQSLSLQHCSVPRVAFITQMSCVLVPLVETLLSRLPSQRIIGAAFLSLAGVAQLLYAPERGATANVNSRIGDALASAAAIFYSMHILRLGTHARRHDSAELAFTKVRTQCVGMAVLLLLKLVLQVDVTAWRLAIALPVRAAPIVLWTGLISCALPMAAQGYGQAHVCAAYASIIYATAPLVSVLSAALVLGQRVGRHAMLGGTLIMFGHLMTISITAR